MNKHFPVVNKRATTLSVIIMAIAILLFSLALSKRISSGSMIWVLPVIVCIIVFLLAMMILISVITAGIDVKNGQVVFSEASGQGRKEAQFLLKDLKAIELHNDNGIIQNPETDSLIGARIVFLTRLDGPKTYYPVQITCKQYMNIKTGLLSMVKDAQKYNAKPIKKKPQTKAEKMAAKIQKDNEKKAVKAKDIKKL